MKKPSISFFADNRCATATALTEDQVIEVISAATGSNPSHRDKAARFIEWRLTERLVLRAEFAADLILIRESSARNGAHGRSEPLDKFVIQLSSQQAQQQIIAAVESIHRAAPDLQKSTVMLHL